MIMSLGIAIMGIVYYFNGYDTGLWGFISIMAWTGGYMSAIIIWNNTLDRIKQLEKALEKQGKSN